MNDGKQAVIRLRGVRQHNLQGIDLDIPLHRIIAVSGVSGSGKSSLAMHTLYAEGQRRYVETFSPYARQFLERMERPEADLIEGIPPAIAVESGTTVRSSRSTVGTVTEINDHLKVLYARKAQPHCPRCGGKIIADSPETIQESLRSLGDGCRVLICFPHRLVDLPDWRQGLIARGFLRIYCDGRVQDLEDLDGAEAAQWTDREVLVVVDRLPWKKVPWERVLDSLRTAMAMGGGRCAVLVLPGETFWFSETLGCARCGIEVPAPVPNLFSFNSPLGACEECRGFGRIIGVDWNLVIPDRRLSIRRGAIRPWSPDRSEYDDLLRFCEAEKIPVDVPFADLPLQDQRKIIDGTPSFYGVRGFFEWLETKTYKMHVRVFLSRYRAYIPCPQCGGSRYRPEVRWYRLAGVAIDQLLSWPVARCREFFARLRPQLERDPAAKLLVDEIESRLAFLHQVGLDYLSLDRQSRTLSGGEVQRVHLTRILGSSLANVLVVLDEPSVGLHARDQDRLMSQLRRLRDLGNTVVVVEHDPGMIRSCDQVIDIGPEGGERGGRIVYQGSPRGLAAEKRSLTGRYLDNRASGRSAGRGRRPGRGRAIVVENAVENNLKNITVGFPLGLFIGVSGVSGSGKSTLVETTLYRGWLRSSGQATEEPGHCAAIHGLEQIERMVLVDQQPIGRTPRANLLTYTKVLDPLRKLFARQEEARARGYSARHFSFNVAGGRCEQCRGEGFERVQMQFLADVMVRCPRCGGRRFKDEILEIRLRGLSIADVLNRTARELVDVFSDHQGIIRALQPVVDLGLDYLRLGQPLNTLSGGEAQRLKLIRYLADGGREPKTRPHLFLLDEPTTGLHPHDLRRLLDVIQRLVDRGHTVVAVEHNLDLLSACDWIIDLGPEGGDQGGDVVACGPPETIMEAPQSVTGRFIRALCEDGSASGDPTMEPVPVEAQSHPRRAIRIHGAWEHNLQVPQIDIPREQMTVITGLSGSGKSSLAFDVLFAEGQRRYLECLSTYVRQYFKILEKPHVDQILGLPPTVAIEQRSSRLGRNSTVATITEIYHFLRLLYAKMGEQYCPGCGRRLRSLSFDEILELVEQQRREVSFSLSAPVVRGRKGIYRDLLGRLRRMGYRQAVIDGRWIALEPVPKLARHREHDIEVVVESHLDGIDSGRLAKRLRQALALGGGSLVLRAPWEGGPGQGDRPAADTPPRVLSQHLYCHHCSQGLAPLDPRLFSFNSRHGACPSCGGTGLVQRINVQRLLGPPDLPLKDTLLRLIAARSPLKKRRITLRRFWCDELGISPDEPFAGLPAEVQRAILFDGKGRRPGLVPLMERLLAEKGGIRQWQRFLDETPCPQCHGRRLNAQARAVRFRDRSISDMVALSIGEFRDFWQGLAPFPEHQRPILAPIARELLERTEFLLQVGLDYLELDRTGNTLSGGEAQRIRLAAQLGSNLRGVCYILDEPTIGLHPQDNERLLESLEQLKDRGNTVLVVEHDPDTLARADRVIELGPGAGKEGGRVTAVGTFDELRADPQTLTGKWFGSGAEVLAMSATDETRVNFDKWLRVRGAAANNLDQVDVDLPLGALTCVTGVSGSGKSTLVEGVIQKELERRLKTGGAEFAAGKSVCSDIRGCEHLNRVLNVDHKPIGRTPRSTPATYLGVWDEIRRLFASLPESRARGFGPGRFSFNVKGGRCDACGGQGTVRVEMNFLPDVYVPCEVCDGRRFNRETLAITYRDRTIADILAMTIEEATLFFDAYRKISRPLRLLCDLGMGYLSLGQPSPTLSGGEAQRLKLATELSTHRRPTLYLLDEPTTGLHRADVRRLITVLRKLTAQQHTVLVIEHNLDLIRAADYVVDLGPGSGRHGGRVVAAGPPGQIRRMTDASATARALARV